MSKFIILSVLLAVGLEAQAKPSPNLGFKLFSNANSFFGQSATDTITEVKEAISTGMEIRDAVRKNVLSIMTQMLSPLSNIPASLPTGGISAGIDAAANLGGLGGKGAAKENTKSDSNVKTDDNAAKEDTKSDTEVKTDDAAAKEDTKSDAEVKTDDKVAKEDAKSDDGVKGGDVVV